MKKFIASIIVCGFAVAMVACGGKKAEEAAAAVDSAAAKIDTVAQKVDSTVNAVVDSAKAVVK
jgi:outer membrane lipoprotein-sorting protein